MSIQHIETYKYKDQLSLQIVGFEKACLFNKPEQVEMYSIYWIRQGRGIYYIDFKKYEFQDNMLIFLSPGQIFNVVSEKVKKAFKISFTKNFYCIQTHDKAVACNGVLFNNVYQLPYIEPNVKDVERLCFVLGELQEELGKKEVAQHDMLQAYLKQFIIYSVRIQKEQAIIKIDVETKLFKDFSTLVEMNFKKLHTVTDYADRLGVSPKSLAKNFQRVGAIAPSEFIKNRILIEAKRRLIYSDQSVKEIAYDLGFNDAAYFTRFFTKIEDKSPLKFRKEYFL